MEVSHKVSDDSVKESSCRLSEPPAEKTRCHDPAKNCKIVEIAVLCVVMVVLWLSLSLPVLFFYLPAGAVTIPPDPSSCTNSTCDSAGSSSGSGSMAEDSQADTDVGSGDSTDSLVCRENFYVVEGPNVSFCAAECPSWQQSPSAVSVLVDKVVLVCACIGVMSACAVLVISVIRRKHIFVFPSVFTVYLTISLLVLGVFFIINYFDREKLFCKSRNLLESTLDPTEFCIIAGVVFYYTLFQITLWWFFHIAALFWGFRFPFHYRSFKRLKRLRYVHIACVVLGLVIPVTPVLVAMVDFSVEDRNDPRSSKGLGFGFTNFPPILCAGVDANATFYSLILPVVILTEVGMTLLVFTFWDIRKTHSYGFLKVTNDSKKKTRRLGVGSGERKIIIVLLYYTLLVEFALVAFTLAMRQVEEFRTLVLLHFQCESRGFNPDAPCDRSKFEDTRHPFVSMVAYILLLLFPVINFTFVIKFRVVKKWFWRHVLKREESSTSNFATEYSVSQSVKMKRIVSIDNSVDVDVAQDERVENPKKMVSVFSVDLPTFEHSPYLGGHLNRVGTSDNDSAYPLQTTV